MRTIVHLSDLHFGRVDPDLLRPLQELVNRLAPDVVVVSGDLTQRAKTEEFKAARAWLDTLPGPQIVVPGNHDIPLYNVASRFLTPLRKYTRYVTLDLAPEYVDDEIAVLGINTARSLTFKDGRVNKDQVAFIRDTFARTPKESFRVLVTHHPLFAMPIGSEFTPAIGRQELALDAVENSGVDMLLAGHNHHASSQDASELVTRAGGVLVIQAGTATSTRVREQEQSFNTIDIDPACVTVTVNAWDGERFAARDSQPYKYQDGRWRILKSEEAAH